MRIPSLHSFVLLGNWFNLSGSISLAGCKLVFKSQHATGRDGVTSFPSVRPYLLIQGPCCCCSSITKLYLTLCDPMDCSTPGLPVHHQLPEFTQTRVHWVGDAIQPSNCLLSPSPPAFNLSQHQGLFQSVGFLHQVAKLFPIKTSLSSFWGHAAPRARPLYLIIT